MYLRPLLICLIISFPILTFGQSCYKRLCLQDQVIDQYGWGGSVIGFEESKDEVVVSLSHNPGKFSFAYSELGVKVRCFKELCEGDEVVDPYDAYGYVYEIYDHGIVKFFDPALDFIFHFNYTRLRKP